MLTKLSIVYEADGCKKYDVRSGRLTNWFWLIFIEIELNFSWWKCIKKFIKNSRCFWRLYTLKCWIFWFQCSIFCFWKLALSRHNTPWYKKCQESFIDCWCSHMYEWYYLEILGLFRIVKKSRLLLLKQYQKNMSKYDSRYILLCRRSKC